MIRSLSFAIFLFVHLFAGALDFDVVVVGTSPISLLEALYQHHTGKKVLILEAASECGGAWKSISVCGVKHADLGCHQLGSDTRMIRFLKETVGCEIIAMDHPDKPPIPSNLGVNGFYFVNGCYEMIRNIEKMIRQTDMVLLLNHPLESVYIDPLEPQAIVSTRGLRYSTRKVIVTPCSEIKLENHPTLPLDRQTTSKGKYYHLYMLIQDATAPRFSYLTGRGEGVSRMMNLTHFVDLDNSGNQLIVLQLHGERYFNDAHKYMDHLKKQQLIEETATLIQAESHIYEQPYYNQSLVTQMPNGLQVFELLQTGAIASMGSYISKWEQAIAPLTE
ncbi:MAG: hypothetical protein K2P51_01380 [Rhabdochlamydiaceae bacterium]|nr:hypothetical protein [Rhabdochlamydiaceae bacterium]